MQNALRRTPGTDAVEEARRIELAQQQLRRMEAVAEGEHCREQSLLLSVGELVRPCGRCDRCLSQAPRLDWSDEAKAVLECLAQEHGTDARSLSDRLNLEEGRAPHWGWLTRRLGAGGTDPRKQRRQSAAVSQGQRPTLSASALAFALRSLSAVQLLMAEQRSFTRARSNSVWGAIQLFHMPLAPVTLIFFAEQFTAT